MIQYKGRLVRRSQVTETKLKVVPKFTMKQNTQAAKYPQYLTIFIFSHNKLLTQKANKIQVENFTKFFIHLLILFIKFED